MVVEWLPKFGGLVKQTEDEISAINMAIGSALTGTRTMTATCGPRIALMQEGIGQLGMGEIPVVIVTLSGVVRAPECRRNPSRAILI